MSVEVLGGSAWTPQQAAAHVIAAWQDAVESIIETGRRLVEAKERVGHGHWLDTVALLPFSDRTAQALMQLARHPDLANPQHVAHLPASWGTLAVLAQLPPGEIPRRIEAGDITPELERATAQEWLSAEKAQRFAREQNALIGLANACDLIDRLTTTLSDEDVLTIAPQAGGRLPDRHQVSLLISYLLPLQEEGIICAI